jgi:hypothetical protein
MVIQVAFAKKERPLAEVGIIKTTFVSGVTILRFVDEANEFLKRVDVVQRSRPRQVPVALPPTTSHCSPTRGERRAAARNPGLVPLALGSEATSDLTGRRTSRLRSEQRVSLHRRLPIDFDVMPVGAEALSLYTRRGSRSQGIAAAYVSTAQLRGSCLLA